MLNNTLHDTYQYGNHVPKPFPLSWRTPPTPCDQSSLIARKAFFFVPRLQEVFGCWECQDHQGEMWCCFWVQCRFHECLQFDCFRLFWDLYFSKASRLLRRAFLWAFLCGVLCRGSLSTISHHISAEQGRRRMQLPKRTKVLRWLGMSIYGITNGMTEDATTDVSDW